MEKLLRIEINADNVLIFQLGKKEPTRIERSAAIGAGEWTVYWQELISIAKHLLEFSR